jgi:hypothetical protein
MLKAEIGEAPMALSIPIKNHRPYSRIKNPSPSATHPVILSKKQHRISR